jgi:thiamine kinase-like enzyme
VICHGDIHPQNVLMSDGEVVIIDWDTVCIGPPEWDHAALMTWASRWGGDPKTDEDFAQGYGADLRPSDAAQLLMRLRLLAPTINLAGRAAREPRFAAELKRRLEYWHGITNPATWTAQ